MDLPKNEKTFSSADAKVVASILPELQAEWRKALGATLDRDVYMMSEAKVGELKKAMQATQASIDKLAAGLQSGINEPRYPTLPGIMKAKKKEVKAINLATLGLPADQLGAAGSRVKILKYSAPPSRPPGKIVSGEIIEAAQKLVKLLREEAKII